MLVNEWAIATFKNMLYIRDWWGIDRNTADNLKCKADAVGD
jgi:hypothetical protein